MKKTLVQKTMVLMLAFLMLFGMVAQASNLKQEDDVDIQVRAGEFSLKSLDINNFGEIILKEDIEQYSTSFVAGDFIVKDLRGTQAGWRIDLNASQFTSQDNPEITLPKGSLTLDGVSQLARVGGSAHGSTGIPGSKLAETLMIDNGSIEIMKANQGTGMGVFSFKFPKDALTISIDPVTAISGQTYVSTLTWDLIQAP